MTANKWLQNGRYYRPNDGTALRDTLPPAIYEIARDDDGYYLGQTRPVSDEIIPLPGCATERVMAGVQAFWQDEVRQRYARRGLLYKRGVLMFGPPGSGKSIVIRRLSDMLVAHNGIVIQGNEPSATKQVLRFLRERETRPIALIYEDINIWVKAHGDMALTSIFDGESQIENIVYIATTNNIEELSPRLVNRPSRFDELIEVGMPAAAGRRAYLLHAFKRDGLVVGDGLMIEQWVGDTEGFSVAHLRELVVSVMCLEQPYEDVLGRLKKMLEGVHAEDLVKRPAVRSVRRPTIQTLLSADLAAESQLPENAHDAQSEVGAASLSSRG